MTPTPMPFRILGLALVVGLAAVGVACNGLPGPGENGDNTDPSVRALLTPDVPVAPQDPSDPGLPGAAATGAGPRLGQRWPGPMDVVLLPPPEVAATMKARMAQEKHYRDGGATVVYLNFEGQAITYVSNDEDSRTNKSWITGKNVTIPAFNASHWGSNRSSIISTIVSDLQTFYAGYNITFTTTRPASGAYMMTMVGGTAALIGQPRGVLGVSMLDCDNQYPYNLNFICSEDIASDGCNLHDLADVIAHECAHTFGLEHITRTNDIMYYQVAAGSYNTWGAGNVKSGEGSCSGGTNYQDDKAYLTKNIGGTGVNPETTPPTVAITSPASGATETSSFTVTVTATDASGIASVELWKDGALFDSIWTTPYQFTLVTQPAGSHTLQAKASDIYGNVGTSAVVTFVVPSGPPPAQCTTDAQCGSNQKCQSGSCVDNPPPPTGGVLGASCSRNEDCLSTWCILGAQNYCTQACNQAQNLYCPAGYYCSADGFCLSSTPIPPGATGAPCAQNAQCRSSICADGANNGYCTSVCQPNGPACPNGSSCVDSGDGRTYVCGRPPAPALAGNDGGTNDDGGGGRGCAAARTSPSTALGSLALVLLGVMRRRPRRH